MFFIGVALGLLSLFTYLLKPILQSCQRYIFILTIRGKVVFHILSQQLHFNALIRFILEGYL